ncbi:S-layer homology domain-containing protein [Anoxybacterium hadale]|uniref:S-layer homology domain-containing protein n=1 Tax=Anoxybacterium hadale TaxID=3408580 RepID=UPI003AFF6192
MNLKRLICCVFAALLCLPIAAPTTSYSASKFTDVSGHWAEKYINTAINKKFASGYPDGRFLPDKAVTRAEFSAMVNKALGNTSTASLSFRDVPRDEWYYNDVAKALSAAYTAGYDDNTFRPDSPITRQEAAVMISRIVPSYGAKGNLKSFSDYRSIADWAYDALDKVNGKGYIGAYNDGKIHPEDQLTRAQTAKILCDLLDQESIVSGNTTVDRNGTKLSGKVYVNNVTIDKSLDEGSATIENCIILGNLSVKGGGSDSITISNSRVANASVDKNDDDPVRILAKGETAIVKLSAEQAAILQASSLSGGLFGPGFSSVTAGGSAQLTLKGSFPRLNITGSKAKVTLSSGSIDTLTVDGRYSEITAESGTSISTATVNAESYFFGSGSVSQMNVNANGVTYETKPKKWTIASKIDTPKQSDAETDITFSPKDKATKVKRDTKITITFGSAVKLYDGSTLTSSDVEDFVTLRKGSSSGSKVSFEASVNSAKTVITITPKSSLATDTKYYVIMDKNSVKDKNGKANTAQSIYFSTGDSVGEVTTTFSPANGASAVPVNTGISISFSEEVVRYSNGATISSSDSYLKDCIVFKKDSSSGSSVAFTAKINSSKKTITITPSSNLTLNQKYYLAVSGKKLKTADGDVAIEAKAVSWTTGVTTPVVDALTLTPGETSISASITSNIAGTAYLVALPAGDTAPNAAQIIAGQNASGIALESGYKASGALTAKTAKTFSLTGFASSTQYKIYAVVRTNNVNSPVKNASTSTIRPVSTLTKLEVIPVVNGSANQKNLVSFNKGTTAYNISLNTGIPSLIVKASGSGDITIDGTASKDNITKEIALTGSNQTIDIKIAKSGTDSTTYRVTVNSKDDFSISTLKVSEGSRTLTDNGGRSFSLTSTGDALIKVEVTASDPYAIVELNGKGSLQKGSTTFTLSASETVFTFTITSGSESGNYKLKFTRPEVEPEPTKPDPEPTKPDSEVPVVPSTPGAETTGSAVTTE